MTDSERRAGHGPSQFGQALRHLRRRAGLSQAALAQVTGISTSTIGSLEDGTAQHPQPPTLMGLARYFGVESEEAMVALWQAGNGGLTGGVGAVDDADAFSRHVVTTARVRHIGRGNGGPGGGMLTEGKWVRVTTSVLVGHRPERVVIVRLVGRCLEPVYYDGDDLLVDTTATPRQGSAVVVYLPDTDELLIKRWQVQRDGTVLLTPDPQSSESGSLRFDARRMAFKGVVFRGLRAIDEPVGPLIG